MDFSFVYITTGGRDEALAIGKALVEERLAACANVLDGVRSIYRWEGQVQDDAEVMLVIKTRADRCQDLATRVTELHPYDLPEVLVLPVVGGSQPYLEWVFSETQT